MSIENFASAEWTAPKQQEEESEDQLQELLERYWESLQIAERLKAYRGT